MSTQEKRSTAYNRTTVQRDKQGSEWLIRKINLHHVNCFPEDGMHYFQSSAPTRTAGKRVRKLESSSAFSHSKKGNLPVFKGWDFAGNPFLGENNSAPSDVRQRSDEGVEKRLGRRGDRRGGCLVPHVVLTLLRSRLRFSEMVQRSAQAPSCQWDRDQTVCETMCCVVEVTPKDVLDPDAHFFNEDGTSCCGTYRPLLQRHSCVRSIRQQRPQSTASCLHPVFESALRHAPSGRVKRALSCLA